MTPTTQNTAAVTSPVPTKTVSRTTPSKKPRTAPTHITNLTSDRTPKRQSKLPPRAAISLFEGFQDKHGHSLREVITPVHLDPTQPFSLVGTTWIKQEFGETALAKWTISQHPVSSSTPHQFYMAYISFNNLRTLWDQDEKSTTPPFHRSTVHLRVSEEPAQIPHLGNDFFEACNPRLDGNDPDTWQLDFRTCHNKERVCTEEKGNPQFCDEFWKPHSHFNVNEGVSMKLSTISPNYGEQQALRQAQANTKNPRRKPASGKTVTPATATTVNTTSVSPVKTDTLKLDSVKSGIDLPTSSSPSP